jgi:cytochrome P450
VTGSRPRAPFLYDPFDPSIQADPYPVYQALRDDHPVYWSHASRSWVLSRHADVGAALDDPATFSSASGIYPTPRGIDMTQLFLPMMIMTDPPRHSQLRALVSRAFTPRRIARLEAGIDTLSSQLLDDATTGTGCDIATEVAGPLPAMVIADLLGVPGTDRHQFRE